MIRSLQIVNRFKAEAARLESQGDGAPDSEALFASNVKAKQPEILAAGAGYN
ncbi:NADH dehydrogenase [Bacillus luti]|nr:NADH dehydrogenase [Bacillus luti]